MQLVIALSPGFIDHLFDESLDVLLSYVESLRVGKIAFISQGIGSVSGKIFYIILAARREPKICCS